MQVSFQNLTLSFSADLTHLASLRQGGAELLHANQQPLFCLRARDAGGTARLFSAADAIATADEAGLHYQFHELTVDLSVTGGEQLCLAFSVENRSALALEYIDLPSVTFAGALRANGGSCAVVSSYNEGLLVEDWQLKNSMTDPEYPSQGNYMMYPYMLSAPFTMWLYGGQGLLMSVQDAADGPKGLDFLCGPSSTQFRTRLFLGGQPGGSIPGGITVTWQHFTGDWQDGAAIYRRSFCGSTAIPTLRQAPVPDWYKNDLPLVITYPVRGIHDMDEMTPNKLFPYHNVLPIVEELAQKTGAKIMVLLMHWEGTAPWAPPYVWPPFGGAELFCDFMHQLHASGHLLGVYCSGFGFTEQSNLIAEYNTERQIQENGLAAGFCRAPDGSLPHSRICTGQRSGYDICPASGTGKAILNDALAPLLASGVDYIQALDQNHGGGMYFCYGSDHGHPPVPGSWMTVASLELLRSWKAAAPATLLGCESAAAQAYMDPLRLSDNRYELCWMLGKPIPLYAFLYHEYLHNFMGNQVCCPIEDSTAGLLYRIGYSFAAGDLITLVLNDDGQVMFHWGMRDFSRTPDRDTVIAFCAALQKCQRENPALFRDARMQKPQPYSCAAVTLALKETDRTITDKAVLSTAWQVEDKAVQLFVNHTDRPQPVMLADGRSFTVPALDAVVM